MRARSIWGAVALTAAVVLGFPSAALAAEPVTLESSRVLDESGVLDSSGVSSIEDAVDELRSETGADLWVVYVDTFENPSDAAEWANTTAQNNGLGPNQYLLAVATEARTYYLSGDSGGPVTDDQLGDIEQRVILPQLSDGDWAGAGVAAAQGLINAISGDDVTDAPGRSDGASSGTVWIVLLVLAAAALVLIVVLVRRRRKTSAVDPRAGEPAELAAISTEDLGRQAGSALIETDDSVRTSEQELGFAIAQYGEESAVAFREAITTAKSTLSQAFTLQQKLDDAEPDTEQQVRAWNAEIIQLCTDANAALDTEAAAFDQLRQIEKNAPDAVVRLRTELGRVSSRTPAAEATLAQLASRYSPAALGAVADNIEEAEERLRFASTGLAAAEQDVREGDLSTAAVGIRATEESLKQAGILLDAIDHAASDLQTAEQSIRTLSTELQTDLQLARSQPDPEGALANVIGATEGILAEIDADRAQGVYSPVEMVQRLEAANRAIDGVLQQVRDAESQKRHAQTMLAQSLSSAQAQVAAAEEYVTTRRGAVGAEARTRLAEAGRNLTLATQLQASDSVSALAYAQRANDLAQQAMQYAQNDVGGFSNSYGGSGLDGLMGGGRRSGDGSMGAILGGILIGQVLGGGGGMFGGGGGRSSAGFGGGFGGGGRSSGRSAGSFGGSGSRSRRGGGRF
ncbi:putative membrane protein YgcG [Okibacterium sp. HSC-33S16]|uniref:TPM domain-containing protein n=1 Tax=Okibacterium sp. HSC-33S16 TaxID=2910965 RepID=UPI0020A171CF|nr:TPM domain-containing protein [Okibacterium sp. HSC-33S16]MCP2031780.1 putative membrane protein YgcG [Okibacterium sp. HSC-33S16]